MKAKRRGTDAIAVFPSALGWMAIVGQGERLRRLVMGYPSPGEALAALGDGATESRVGRCAPRLVKRLQAYARGAADDFRDVKLDLGPRTEFQRRVLAACRRIRRGKTSNYAALAKAAGYPRAARAVGNVMATNPVPLLIPCHRVLASGGKLGGYSARTGMAMKTRLLALEAAKPASNAPRSRRRKVAAV
ncbi:MAG: MGMT family protein [Planctomycetia bacterium]|nr:MGMT family protein [Planctomycetia bacterium]